MQTKVDKGSPVPEKQYRIIGGPGEPALSNGNTWAESEVGGEADVRAKISARVAQYVELVQSLQEPAGHVNYCTVSAEFGPKYARIVCADSGRRVHSFINLANGDVLKAKGWKGPELKNPRANIFADDIGASGISKYGVNYLR